MFLTDGKGIRISFALAAKSGYDYHDDRNNSKHEGILMHVCELDQLGRFRAHIMIAAPSS
ncbi:hypothetical protein WK02_23020 [Burkholderia cepacia]|nr:hypothetical protein WJ46_05190 [Burkholderia cepacia]KVQ27560.1 hypothetical protein WK02_23020 [Burkholderia cepacia]